MASGPICFAPLSAGSAMEEVETVEVVADLGFAGCARARKGGNRQVLLVDRETLDTMELRPGILREKRWRRGSTLGCSHFLAGKKF